MPLSDSRRALLAVALLALPGAAAAQELLGTIRLSDGGTPAPGIVLEASRPGGNAPVARAISGENGGFALRLTPGTFRLRALRIGYRPTEFGTYTLGAGERRRLELTLGDRAVQLAAITSRASARCAVGERAGEAVATLFDEARKALLAALLSPPEGRPSARILLEQSVTEPDGTIRVAAVRAVADGFAARPFRSAPPAQLAALGYAIEEPDGTVYFAPDANVLLSDQFAAAHCLRLAATDSIHPTRIGIAFQPVGAARGRVRIRGTLWLDRATYALERLDFGYVGLPAGLDDAGLGGSIEFAQLPGGLWFEDRWEIRMPRLRIERQARVSAIGGTGSSDIVRLDAVQRAGGRVLSIARPERVLYRSAGAEPEAIGRDDVEALRTASFLMRAACSIAAAPIPNFPSAPEPRSTVVGLVLEPDASTAAGARVSATWQEGFRIDAGDGITWRERTIEATAEGDGFYALCGLPRERRFLLQARAGTRRSPRTMLRVEAEADHTRADLRFVSAR